MYAEHPGYGDSVSEYTVLRHARVKDPEVVWVAIARWDYEDGTTEWTLEYWDEQGEAGEDQTFGTQVEAEAQAMREFRLGQDAWIPGANRFGPAGDQPSALG
jgi:hypothetical protein